MMTLRTAPDGQRVLLLRERVIRSTDMLVRTYRADAQYFRLTPVDVSAAVAAVKDLGGSE